MNAISYNIENYYDDSILKEIEEICNGPYLIIRDIKLFFKTTRTKRRVKKIEKINLSISKSLYELDYSKIIDVESKVKEILKSLTDQATHCKSCGHSQCKLIYLTLFYRPLKASFENLLNSISHSYHINSDDVFNSEEEYVKNNEALRVFSDLWDYPSSNEEKELAFNQNRRLMRS